MLFSSFEDGLRRYGSKNMLKKTNIPKSCQHVFTSVKRCSFIHYKNLHTIWQDYPGIEFKPSALPDEDCCYYLICRKLCDLCQTPFGQYTLTGPTEGFR